MDLKHREEDLAGRRGLSLAVKCNSGRKLCAHLLDGGGERTLLRPSTPWREDPTPHFPLIMNLRASKEGQGHMEIDTTWISCPWVGMLSQSWRLLLLLLQSCSFSLPTPPVSEIGSLCSPGYPRTLCVSQAQCLPATCCRYRCRPPCLASRQLVEAPPSPLILWREGALCLESEDKNCRENELPQLRTNRTISIVTQNFQVKQEG